MRSGAGASVSTSLESACLESLVLRRFGVDRTLASAAPSVASGSLGPHTSQTMLDELRHVAERCEVEALPGIDMFDAAAPLATALRAFKPEAHDKAVLATST